MVLFFVLDYQQKYRLFTTEAFQVGEVRFSRWQTLWTKAKEKLLLLPPRILHQEQALAQILKHDPSSIDILVSGRVQLPKLHRKFAFFLQKQKTSHLGLIIGEILLLPISGLAALLPGPNVFFGFLALLLNTHWRAWRGVRRLQSKKLVFKPHPLLQEWEEAVENQACHRYPAILQKLNESFQYSHFSKILWK